MSTLNNAPILFSHPFISFYVNISQKIAFTTDLLDQFYLKKISKNQTIITCVILDRLDIIVNIYSDETIFLLKTQEIKNIKHFSVIKYLTFVFLCRHFYSE